MIRKVVSRTERCEGRKLAMSSNNATLMYENFTAADIYYVMK